MITFDQTLRDAQQITQGHTGPKVVKFALWIAALSAQQSLANNARLAKALRPHVNGHFESIEDVYKILKPCRANLNGCHLNAIMRAQELEEFGLLDDLEHIGTTRQEQIAWREKVRVLMRGFGMGWKTISFAALLLDPLHCELVPVDVWVLTRLGFDTTDTRARYFYHLVEDMIQTERAGEGKSHIPLGLYHWWKWLDYRDSKGATLDISGFDSHADLSPRNF